MFAKTLLTFLLAQLFLLKAAAEFGKPKVWLGYNDPNVNIIEVETTILLPSAPHLPKGYLVAWAGMRTWRDDFVQSIFESSTWPNCPKTQDQWCVYGYLLECVEGHSKECNATYAHDLVTIDSNTRINVHYVHDKATDMITQTVKRDGRVISSIVQGRGKGQYLEFAVECVECAPATMPPHSWVDTRIVLEKPYMPFGVPVAKEEVEYGNFGTSDNGKTWTIDWLHMNEAKFGQTSQRELTTAATSSIPNASKFVPPKESSKPSPHPLIRRGDPAVDALHLRWGPHWGGRVDPAKNYIESVDTTLVMPKTQSPQNARLEIWPSVFTTGQDLIQVVSISTDANGRKACNAKAGQWCSYASVYHVGATGQLTDGTSYAVDAGQIMNIKYEYDDHTGNTTQTVKLDGRLVDKFSTSSGKPYDYYLTVECQVWAHGPMDAHSYRYTTIRLNKADMSYRDAFQGTNMSHSDIETHDGGKTWYIDWIHVNESWFEKVLD